MASTSSHGHRRRLALPLPPLPLPLLLSLLLAVLFGGARGQPCDTAALVDQAQSVIRKNYDAAHGWTVPSPGVAPFLSSTDSLFAAYAASHFDPDAGMRELLANLDGQWAESGLIPRIRFPQEAETEPWLPGTFFPGPTQWKAPRDASPQARATAGLAAPPWHAFVAMQLFNSRRDDAGLDFLAQAFPKLYKYHKCLHEARDAGDHLVLTYHPWESELPYDSPAWAEALEATQARIAAEKWAPTVSPQAVEGVPGFPGADVFAAELYLVELLAQKEYHDSEIQAASPYLAVDVEFNAILAAADVSLASMAKVLQLHSSSAVNDTARGVVTSWAGTSATRLEYLWAGDRYATYFVSPSASASASAPATIKEQPQPLPQPQAEADEGGIISPAKRRQHERERALRHHARPPPPAAMVKVRAAAPPPPPPPTPLPEGAFLSLPLVNSFFPLLPGGLAPARFEGLLFQIITPGIASSFDCQGQNYRLPTSGCAVPDPQPEVSLLHNWAVQRGLANNGDTGFNRWLLNETVALICASSMDPFSTGAGGAKKRGVEAGPFHFARFFDPVDGTPVPDMFGGAGATMAAALVFTLLYPDAPNVTETPPLSHDMTFALVVIELIIAFATGVGCFLFSLSLFRRLSKADEEGEGVMASMLHVADDELEYGEQEGDDDEGGSAFGDDDEEGEGGGGETKQQQRQRRRQRAAVAQGRGTPVKQQQQNQGSRRRNGGRAGGGGGGRQYQTFRGIFSSPSRSGGSDGAGAGPAAAAAGSNGAGGAEGAAAPPPPPPGSSSGTGLVGSVTGAVRSAASFLKFW